MNLPSITQARSLRGKRILVRCGFDVPIKNGKIQDTSRIAEALKTLLYLKKKNARIILITHLGRPKGKRVAQFSARPVENVLSRFLKTKVQFIDDCIGEKVERAIKSLGNGEIILLENLRFHEEEEKNNQRFAKQLAQLGDIYVNEAFSNSHRRHASMVGIPKFLPSYAGFHLICEVVGVIRFLKEKKRPQVAVIGGVKISSKLGVILKMLGQVDHVLLGGALANTALASTGISIGKSFVEPDMVRSLKKFPLINPKLHMPVDVLVSQSLEKPKCLRTKAVGGAILKNEYIVDIGPDTIVLYTNIISKAKTIFFAGPMGKFEVKAFAHGTQSVLSAAKKVRGYTLAGGGDTLHAVHRFQATSYFNYLSSSGGALLALMEKKTLPALDALQNTFKK